MAVRQVRAAVVVVHSKTMGDPASDTLKKAISVVIPVYQDAEALALLLNDLTPLASVIKEIIVVDGCNDPAIQSLVASYSQVSVCSCSPQRARQMNLGAEYAKGRVLWFLHADTRIQQEVIGDISHFVSQSSLVWGRFDVQLEPSVKSLNLVAFMMNWRSRLTGICTGDQGLLVQTDVFRKVGGFPEQPLMEDIELSKRLKCLSRPFIPNHRIVTSSRKWLHEGIFRTIRTMWYLRFIYWLGASPQRIHQIYYGQTKR